MNAKKRNEGVVDVLSGSVRGIAQVLVGHPFDTMKVIFLLLTPTHAILRFPGRLTNSLWWIGSTASALGCVSSVPWARTLL